MKKTFSVTSAIICFSAFSVQAGETIYIAGNGGSIQKIFEEQILPEFEARTGAKTVYMPGNSSDTLAKLLAQKGKQDISLAMIDDGYMFQAIAQDLCAPLPSLSVLQDVYPNARIPGERAIGYGMYATGLAYNKDVFAKNGWPKPSSWNDLADPKFKGKVSMGPISSYGMMALMMVAHANGGSGQDIEPGFKIMAEKIAPNVLAWEASPATIGPMLMNGEAPLIVWGNTRVQPLVDQGAPVEFVYPKEGASLGMVTACIINGSPQPKLAQALLEVILSPEAQAKLAKSAALGPTNSKVKLDPDVAKRVVYGPEQASSLVPLEWDIINKKRPEWTQRWNREVER